MNETLKQMASLPHLNAEIFWLLMLHRRCRPRSVSDYMLRSLVCWELRATAVFLCPVLTWMQKSKSCLLRTESYSSIPLSSVNLDAEIKVLSAEKLRATAVFLCPVLTWMQKSKSCLLRTESYSSIPLSSVNLDAEIKVLSVENWELQQYSSVQC